MPLRGFTVTRRRSNGCPNKCDSWARRIIRGVGMVPMVEGHHPNCPLCPKQECGYCGSTRGFSDGSDGAYPHCLDCGGV